MVGRRESKNEVTRGRLLAAARTAFGTQGFANASMDDFTAAAGLTRGALYHQFGNKEGLFRAVVEQIDSEMAARLKAISKKAPNRWQALVDEWTAYIQMALEPEIQRVMFRDGPAVLGDISQWSMTDGCVMALKGSFDLLQADGALITGDTEAMARLVNGAASHAVTWIASSDDPEETARRAIVAFEKLLQGLIHPVQPASGAGAGANS